ncbi:hypothetical protein [Fusobacterium ulcerans]|uniref:hypothetical protein n=1 Tax=Fusobacterium ulcerans TaxID=861 RepID=UPI001D0A712E|nr:hypothetical protein [Fusobacterium ulcerans]MCB8563679.1 hypothetical protein [Fusobacterium ulcerans]MCB8647946.1 hypothetical protein [Fusobacterium ulcerans]
MEKIIYIYDKNLKLIAQPFIKDYEEFKENPIKYFPSWETTMFASLEKYNNPILDRKTGEIREKTREELILIDNKSELLQDGEYVEDGEIIVVEAPENFIKKLWNKEIHIWEEGATREELIEERKNKILEYKKLKNDKKDLEDSGFSSEEEVILIVEKMELLEANINNLAEKIKSL